MLMAAPAHDETDARPSSWNNPILRWLVVRVYCGAEYQLHRSFLDRGIESLFPHRVGHFKRNKWSRGILCPLFPGYLFVGLEPGQSLDEIRWIPGYIDVLRLNTMPVTLAPGEIAGIRQQTIEAYDTSVWGKKQMKRVKVGDWVAAPDGPFKDVPVRVVAIDKHNRVTASLGNVTVTFALSSLKDSE